MTTETETENKALMLCKRNEDSSQKWMWSQKLKKLPFHGSAELQASLRDLQHVLPHEVKTLQSELLEQVAEGFHIHHVPCDLKDEKSQPYAFTMGLQWHVKQMDLICIGIEENKAAQIVQNLGEMIWTSDPKFDVSKYLDTGVPAEVQEIVNVPFVLRTASSSGIRQLKKIPNVLKKLNSLGANLELPGYCQIVLPNCDNSFPNASSLHDDQLIV